MSILRRKKQPAWKKIAAGAAGGLAGTLAMSGFQALWSKVGQKNKRPLPEFKKGFAGNLTHYAFGTLSGAAYGAIGHKLRFAGAGRGTLFGVGLWALADEVVVPALKLSKAARAYPPPAHLYGLASHLVYGVAADATARLVQRVL
jgi:hypothetical protein